MSHPDPLSELNALLERRRVLLEDAKTNLEDAEADIEAANAEHAATMTRLDQEAAAANAKHRDALNDAVTRRLEAKGTISGLEALSNGK